MRSAGSCLFARSSCVCAAALETEAKVTVSLTEDLMDAQSARQVVNSNGGSSLFAYNWINGNSGPRAGEVEMPDGDPDDGGSGGDGSEISDPDTAPAHNPADPRFDPVPVGV